jgi:glycosyltransferase involved in cell wall biosynthesis
VNGDVLFCGAWDEGPGYPRTTSLRQGLAAAGVTVRECRVPGLGRAKQRLLRAPWRWPLAWWQQRGRRRHLVRELRAQVQAKRPDCIVVPYPGHGVVGAVKAATDVPVVLDLFLSAYDTVIEDRQLVAPGSLGAWWLQQLDRRACASADVVVLDTPANAAYVAELTGVPAERFAWLPVHDPHAAEAVPAPWPVMTAGLELLFFGTGVPLHGLATLIAAVARVPGVRLVLVGGTEEERALARAELGERVRLEPTFVPTARLHELLAQCHLVAGVFGAGPKAQRVVPFKVVHALAAGRPVLTAATPAACQWLDGSGAAFFAPAADAEALAKVLADLVAEPARVARAAGCARPAYERHFGTDRLAARWREVLTRVATAQERA